MPDKPTAQLAEDLHRRIDYWRREGDFTYAEAIGVLEVVKADLLVEMREKNDD